MKFCEWSEQNKYFRNLDLSKIKNYSNFPSCSTLETYTVSGLKFLRLYQKGSRESLVNYLNIF